MVELNERSGFLKIKYINEIPEGITDGDASLDAEFVVCLHTGFTVCFVLKDGSGYRLAFFESESGRFIKDFFVNDLFEVESSDPEVKLVLKIILSHEASADLKGKILCLGSHRVGDYFAQINWLSYFIEKYGDTLFKKNFDGIFYDKKTSFLDPAKIFPELACLLRESNDFYKDALSEGCKNIIYKNLFPDSQRRNYEHLSRRMELYLGVSPSEDEFKIVLSLEVEKRTWINQIECLRSALSYLIANCNKRVKVVLNGMTGTLHQDQGHLLDIINYEAEVAKVLFEKLDVDWIDLSGKDLEEKYFFFKGANFFIAPIGSAAILPSIVLGVPGMAVGSREIVGNKWYRKFVDSGCWMPELDKITDNSEISGLISFHKKNETLSYSIDADYFIKSFVSLVSVK